MKNRSAQRLKSQCGPVLLQYLLIFRNKDIFAHSAERTYPILRKIFKSCAWIDSVVRISFLFVIRPTADDAHILHTYPSFRFIHSAFPIIAKGARNCKKKSRQNSGKFLCNLYTATRFAPIRPYKNAHTKSDRLKNDRFFGYLPNNSACPAFLIHGSVLRGGTHRRCIRS